MRKFIFSLIFISFLGSVFAQTESKLIDKKVIFGKDFVKMVEKGTNNSTYIVDLTKLKSKFERMYFMDLVYKDSKIISMDSDINKDQISFAANNKYSSQEILKIFQELKAKTEQASVNSSAKDKENTLNKNKVK